MPVLNTAYHSGANDGVYSDGSVELTMYERALQGKTEVLPEDEWAIVYHFSPLRENILNWYPFQENCTILEVGGGCGALSGLLAKRAGSLTVCELTMQRAKINFERHTDVKNLDIIVGDFFQIPVTERYDYVILNGVLEYAAFMLEQSPDPYAQMLERALEFLNPNGRLLLAIENRLGIKYFAGAPEDHLGRSFVGIDGYQDTDRVRTFDRKELEEKCAKAGLAILRWYYPYPDYKFPQEIFTEESICRQSPISLNLPLDQDRISLFDENKALYSMAKNGVAGCFSNSFLVELAAANATSGSERAVDYVKISRDRKECFALYTTINYAAGLVSKYPLFDSGRAHLQDLSRRKILRGNMRSLHYCWKEDHAECEYLRMKTLLDLMLECVETQDKERFWAYLEQLRTNLNVGEDRVQLRDAAFEEVFGVLACEEALHWSAGECIDYTPGNIFVNGNEWIIIDYEWCFDFPVPTEFILWRTLLHLQMRKEFSGMFAGTDILEFVGIRNETNAVFMQWEQAFQSDYVGFFHNRIREIKPISIDTLRLKLGDLEREKEDLSLRYSRLQDQNAQIESLRLALEQQSEQQAARLLEQTERGDRLQAQSEAQAARLLKLAELIKAQKELLLLRSSQLREREALLLLRSSQIQEQEEQLAESRARQQAQAETIETLTDRLSQYELLKNDYDSVKMQYDVISNAFFWKVTKPFRAMLDALKKLFCNSSAAHRMWSGLKRIKNGKHESADPEPTPPQAPPAFYTPFDPMTILCTKHTLFVGRLVQRALNQAGISADIITEEPDCYGEQVYFVICPQIFKRMPGRYIAFQMEQTVSSRWLTDKYYSLLENAYTILDYSLVNVSYFKKMTEFGSNFYYLPVDYLPGLRREGGPYEYDVLFYGDANNARRKRILAALQERFCVRVVSEVFGEELYEELVKARVVVNIHYYENAMLETTRIYEVLSLGRSVVVSERSTDPEEEKRLEGIVDFVPVDDIHAMIEHIAYWLEHEDARLDAVERNNGILSDRPNAFNFYFQRMLLANDWIDFDRFYSLVGVFLRFDGNQICLSLPEAVSRRKAFDLENKFGFEVIPGLRHKRGWTGCGLSYKFIMKKAQEQGLESVVVCEDDVFFPPDFEQRWNTSQEYLAEHGDWDIFQGLMADVGRVTVLNVDRMKNQAFVTLDHMISTVFNCYRSSVYDCFIHWDEHNDDVQKNTIDRALEAKDLKIVVTAPFLVGHKEELNSVIWGFNNSQYSEMIERSSEKLTNLIAAYEKKNKKGKKHPR